MTLPDGMQKFIQEAAKKFPIDAVILFGSRAKDTCWEYSDVDLAISGKLDADAYFDFKEELEKYPDLYLFDVVDMNSDFVDADLMNEIAKDGVMIYEKVRTDETSV